MVKALEQALRDSRPGLLLVILMVAGTGFALSAALAADPDAPGPARLDAAEPGDAARAVPGTDEVARFLAGLPTGGGALAALERRPAWVAYSRAIDERWNALDAKQLSKMRDFAARELRGRSDPGREVLYPFSGPDLINVTTLFPGRPAYVLLSLEPVGGIPDFASFGVEEFDRYFAMLQQSLQSALKWDFFQTVELRQDLSVPGLDGALPLLLFFAARDGHEVESVHYAFVGPEGVVAEVPAAVGPPPRGDGVPGVRLTLRRRGAEGTFALWYFAVDLGAYSLDRKRSFFTWLAGRGPFTTYLKAASYLMFKPKYRAIERFILDHSRDLLQDDAGIPFADLTSGGWDVTLYGSYERPIPLFASMYQEDLARAYDARADVMPLPFSVGYKTRPRDSTLMLATKPDR